MGLGHSCSFEKISGRGLGLIAIEVFLVRDLELIVLEVFSTVNMARTLHVAILKYLAQFLLVANLA